MLVALCALLPWQPHWSKRTEACSAVVGFGWSSNQWQRRAKLPSDSCCSMLLCAAAQTLGVLMWLPSRVVVMRCVRWTAESKRWWPELPPKAHPMTNRLSSRGGEEKPKITARKCGCQNRVEATRLRPTPSSVLQQACLPKDYVLAFDELFCQSPASPLQSCDDPDPRAY